MAFYVFENEFLYKFKLSYRKMIPSSKLFYMVLFIVKFFPLILLTHVIDPDVPDKVFTVSKMLRSLTIIGNIRVKSYPTFCAAVYVIILLLLIGISYIFFVYYSLSKKTDYKLYEIPIHNLKIGKLNKFLMKCTVWLLLGVIFFYQHFIDLLYFGVFRLYSKINFFKSYDGVYNYSNYYVIGILNILSILILMALMIIFIAFSSSKTLKSSFGYHSADTLVQTLFNVFYFSLQGLYTSSYFYSDSKREKFIVYLCVILTCVLLIDFLYYFNNFENYLFNSPITLFMNSIKYSCLLSGVLEIYIYYLVSYDQRVSQKYYFLKIGVVFLSGVLITWVTTEFKTSASLKELSNGLFSEANSKKQFDIESLIIFFIQLDKIPLVQDKLIFILKLIQEHQAKCTTKNCRCIDMKSMFQSMEDKAVFEQILRKFIALGERKIISVLLNQSERNYKKFGMLYFIHCDYLFTIKKKLDIAFYLSQYYLVKKQRNLKLDYSYLLYEINYLVFRQKEKVQEGKSVSILKENLESEKIKNMILLLVQKIEKVMILKKLSNANSKLELKCEDFFDPIQTHVKENEKLVKLIVHFTKQPQFEHSTKTKYLIYYYLKLLNVKLPRQIKSSLYKGDAVFPSYDSIYLQFLKNTSNPGNYIISYLNADDKFFIHYISTLLIEKLHYDSEEIIGTDFNETLIPKQISKYHRIYMKEYILLGYGSFKKKTFILNKKFQMLPVFIFCRIIPTIDNLYGLIINIEPIKSKVYARYDLLLDAAFNILCVSESFENQFFFTLRMLNSLKINFCEFFGINKESLTNYFSPSSKTYFPQEKKERIPLASTSYKLEDIKDYQTLNFDNVQRKNPEAVRELIVHKAKVENYLLKLEKTVDELGMEKEWKLLINVLYDKMRRKCASGATPSINEFTSKQTLNDSNFLINIEFKQLGPVQYYTATINEQIDETFNSIAEEKNRSKKYLAFGDELNAALRSGNLDGLFMSLKLRQSKQIFSGFQSNLSLGSPKKDLYSKSTQNLTSTTNDNSITANNSNANFLITGGENNLSKIANNINLEQKKKKNKSKEDDKLNRTNLVKLAKLEKSAKKLRHMKPIQLLLSAGVLTLNIVNLVRNFYTIEYSLNIFRANLYSYFVLNDVLFSSICSINLCFIREGIQSGNSTHQTELIDLTSSKLISDYQQFNYHVTNIISDPNLRPLYETLNEEDEYVSLLSNWEERTYNSTLVDEIYQIYHSLNLFISRENFDKNNCRLNELFFSKNYLKYKGRP